tara:strand:- start:384 stop:1307 length:924 start_codon:yes stop_codon:yes gene_type:complete
MNNYSIGNLSKSAAIDMLIQEVDFNLYYNYLGRNLNTNIHDWSSVLNSRDPNMYKKRMLRKDNNHTASEIFKEINSNKTISINCCEELLLHKELFLKAFKNLKVIVVLRHPVDVVFSWHRTRRGERYGTDKRFIHPTYGDGKIPIPGFAIDWSNEYEKISSIERIVKAINIFYKDYFYEKEKLDNKDRNKYFWVFFENFTVDTENILLNISEFLGTEFSEKTIEMCYNQRLPRKINIKDFNIKYYAIKQHCSPKYFKLFKDCCEKYEKFSNSIFKINQVPKNLKIKKYKNFSDYLKEPDFKKGKRIN